MITRTIAEESKRFTKLLHSLLELPLNKSRTQQWVNDRIQVIIEAPNPFASYHRYWEVHGPDAGELIIEAFAKVLDPNFRFVPSGPPPFVGSAALQSMAQELGVSLEPRYLTPGEVRSLYKWPLCLILNADKRFWANETDLFYVTTGKDLADWIAQSFIAMPKAGTDTIAIVQNSLYDTMKCLCLTTAWGGKEQRIFEMLAKLWIDGNFPIGFDLDKRLLVLVGEPS